MAVHGIRYLSTSTRISAVSTGFCTSDTAVPVVKQANLFKISGTNLVSGGYGLYPSASPVLEYLNLGTAVPRLFMYRTRTKFSA